MLHSRRGPAYDLTPVVRPKIMSPLDTEFIILGGKSTPSSTDDMDRVSQSAAELQDWFDRIGYVRICNTQRRKREGQAYKKGYEVRFALDSRDAVREVQRLLTTVGLRPGKPYRKYDRIVLPVYGRASVEWFVKRLPKGSEQVRHGFAPDGTRLVRRQARKRLPRARQGDARLFDRVMRRVPDVRPLPGDEFPKRLSRPAARRKTSPRR